jgi:amino acid transporter
MTTTTTTAATTTAAAPKIGPVVKAGLAATVVASAATVAVAAVGHAAGISLDMAGEPIPVLGFATLTAFFSVIGVVLAVVLARKARSPHRTFVRTTLVLTALSLVPDAIADAHVGTKMLLMLTHLVAAAIVIPAIARRLSR